MSRSKRIFVIADFKDESPKSIRIQSRMWVKGLLRQGCDVHRFSYRNVMTQFNPFSGVHFRRFAPRFVKRRANRLLAKQIARYYPDVVLILCMKYLDAETIGVIRETAPNAVLVGRDEDPFPERNADRLAIAKQLDIVVNTSCGRFLKTYKEAGVKCAAFLPNVCDPDIQYRYDVDEKWKADIIFTGKPEHMRLDRNHERYDLIHGLHKLPNSRVYGAFGVPRVEGIDYFYAVSGAKMGLSINIANDVRLYHSDRLINYISCGTLVLSKRVPDTDLLFKDGVHIRYFDTPGEFFEMVDWYLKHDKEREKIAQAGMQKAHEDYNCQRIAKYMFDLIDTGKYDAPWAEIL